MTGTEVAAVVAACVATGIAGALVILLVQTRRTLAASHAALEALATDALAAVTEMRDATRRAEFQLDRIDALYSSAEALSKGADQASQVAYRTVRNPVVKAMALGTGTRQAIRRLREERR